MKKILKWTVLAFVILTVFGIISAHFKERERQEIREKQEAIRNLVPKAEGWYYVTKGEFEWQCVQSPEPFEVIIRDWNNKGVPVRVKDDVVKNGKVIQATLNLQNPASNEITSYGTYYHGIEGFKLCQKKAKQSTTEDKKRNNEREKILGKYK